MLQNILGQHLVAGCAYDADLLDDIDQICTMHLDALKDYTHFVRALHVKFIFFRFLLLVLWQSFFLFWCICVSVFRGWFVFGARGIT